jgi:hypothetical protein
MHARWIAVAAAGTLLVAACGSDSEGDATSSSSTVSSTTSTTDATTTSSAEASGPLDVSDGELPDTPLTAPLDQAYGPDGGAFEEATFGIAPGSVTAAWYIAEDTWAVHYDGLTQEAASGTCPGTSIETEAGFEHVTNSPYGALGCAGFTGTVLPPGSLRRCDETTIVYTSQIPIDAEGDLYASVERGGESGIQGITSHVAADATGVPEIDVSGCTVIS